MSLTPIGEIEKFIEGRYLPFEISEAIFDLLEKSVLQIFQKNATVKETEKVKGILLRRMSEIKSRIKYYVLCNRNIEPAVAILHIFDDVISEIIYEEMGIKITRNNPAKSILQLEVKLTHKNLRKDVIVCPKEEE